METGKRKEFDDTSGCPICYGKFDTEECVPRLLPCTHTLCEVCILKILGNKRIFKCPQCRKKHNALTGLNAFPENKYILNNLQAKANTFPLVHKTSPGTEHSLQK